MQISKAPGPDGYTSEFFKPFSSKFHALLNVYNESLVNSYLPPTLYLFDT